MKFLRVNFSTSIGLFALVMLVLVIIVNVIFINGANDVGVLSYLFMALFNLLYIGFILWSLTTTIELSENGVKYKSVFKEVNIEWTQIKSYGVLRQGRSYFEVLDKAKYDKFIWGAQKFIFVSGEKDFFPILFIRKAKLGYIDFHYRPEAMQMIELKMKSINLE